MKFSHLVALSVAALGCAAVSHADPVTALDAAGNTWTLVGSYNVSSGSAWYSNPAVYDGLQAAAAVFGAAAPGEEYGLSIYDNFVTLTNHVDGYANDTYMDATASVAETYSLTSNGGGYASYPSFSALVDDHQNYGDPNPNATNGSLYGLNYVWERSTASVPDTTNTLALMAVALAGLGWGMRKRVAQLI